MLNMAGAAVGISIYLKENPSEKLNAGDAAICGGMAGSIAGFATSILNMISSLLIETLAASLYTSVYSGLPPFFSTLMRETGSGILSIPVNIIIYGAFGALGGFLAMQLFFKDRLAPG